MISPISAIWKAFKGFLEGFAQLFDGTFDYNIIFGGLENELKKDNAFAVLIAIEANSDISRKTILGVGDVFTQRNSFDVRFDADGSPWFRMFNGDPVLNALSVSFDRQIQVNEKALVLFCYDGGLDESGVSCFVNGEKITQRATVFANTMSAPLLDFPSPSYIGRNIVPDYFEGAIKVLEIVRGGISDAQGVKASSLDLGGSFRAGGIPYNNSNYIIAVDFDKQNGENPTAFDDTPFYQITAFGGSTYAPFL